MRRTSCAVLTTTTALLLTACASPSRTSQSTPAHGPASASTTPVPDLPDIAPDSDSTAPDVAPGTETSNACYAWSSFEAPPLDQAHLGDSPGGTGPQIALRFPQELQRGDDLDAYCELPYGARVLGVDTWAQLHLLMNDVRRHAGLAQAGPCTTSQALSATSAVVTCGAQHVVIHVESNDTALGVEIGDWHVHQDVYRGPHTHAFTTVDLW